MTFKEFYEISWFSNLSYVDWYHPQDGVSDISDSAQLSLAAIAQERAPEELNATGNASGNGLATKIFRPTNQGWYIPSNTHGTGYSFEQSSVTGFSATLFANDDPQQKVLAIRGTDQAGLDLLQADILQIGVIGVSLRQAVDLFNFVQRLKAPAGSKNVLQLKLNVTDEAPAGFNSVHVQYDDSVLAPLTPLPEGGHYWFEVDTASEVTGLGMISEGDEITLTGHSLGGHLAAFALRLFPDLFDQAITFNAPGFDPVTGDFVSISPAPVPLFSFEANQLTDEFVALFGEYLSTPAQTFEDLQDRLFTLESEDTAPGDDPDGVAGAGTGNPASPETFITTEVANHSMDQFMDALGVQALIEKMSPNLAFEEVNALATEILTSASNEPGGSEEQFLEALTPILLPDTNPDLSEGSASSFFSAPPFNTRAELHE